MNLKEQIDRDLSEKLLADMKEQLTKYHTLATVAEISSRNQVSSMVATIQTLFLQAAIAAGYSKEVFMEAVSQSYDVMYAKEQANDHS